MTHSAVSGAAGAAPVTEGTLFECASLTKPLFAVLALQLADERLLALDESVPARLGGEPWSQDPDFAKITPPPDPQPQLRLAGLAQPPYAHALCPGYGL